MTNELFMAVVARSVRFLFAVNFRHVNADRKGDAGWHVSAAKYTCAIFKILHRELREKAIDFYSETMIT